mmetsp:Transcript_14489/g.30489  ORF Transcript_14489/g.30489 Transcript_14489/m.30489 type:complete len:114 (+) Transcript_14489:808-1149(+)
MAHIEVLLYHPTLKMTKLITILIDLQLKKSSVENATHGNPVKQTTASTVAFNLVVITAASAISGCQLVKIHIIAKNADFVALGGVKTLLIVMIVECALMPFYLMITIVNRGNT